MKTKTIEQFKTDCLSVIKHYQSDLDYDLEYIKQGKPSLFFAYECGSHCIRLFDFDEYPDKFTRVPYLFGTADREKILSDTGCTLDSESVRNASLVHWFDGNEIRQIDHAKAHQIVRDYKLAMARKFKQWNGLKAVAA